MVLFGSVITLHAGAVKSDVPVSEVLEEVKSGPHDVVELVVLHFVADELDQVLVSSNDPLVHEVGLGGVGDLVLELRVENKVFSSTLFPASNVLDHEAVRVEPGKENVAHNGLDAFLLELKWLRAHNGTVAEVQTNSIGAMRVSDMSWVGVVLL